MPEINIDLKRLGGLPDAHILAMADKMDGVIKMQGGDPDFDTPLNIREALVDAVNSGYTHYPARHGIKELRDEISSYYAGKNVQSDPNDIVVASGSGMALFATASSILNPGDEVVMFEPYYMLYGNLLDYFNVKTIHVPLADGFRLDAEALTESITDKTKMIVLNAPNNPCGTVYNRKELKAIRDICVENDVMVLSDEVYNEFIWEGEFTSIASIPEMAERTMIVNSFSKTFAMTGWRLGYILAPPWLSSSLKKLPIGYRTNTFVQMAGADALRNSWDVVEAMKKVYLMRREFMVKRLNEIDGVTCQNPEGAFYTFPEIATDESTVKFAEELLKNEKILVRPGLDFGKSCDRNLRIPLIKPLDVLEKVADGVERQVKKLKV